MSAAVIVQVPLFLFLGTHRSSFFISLHRHNLTELIDSTLDLLVSVGGRQALQAIKAAVPTYSYFDPKDD